jgi:hypothetical protein
MNTDPTTAHERLTKRGIRLQDSPSPFDANVPALPTIRESLAKAAASKVSLTLDARGVGVAAARGKSQLEARDV